MDAASVDTRETSDQVDHHRLLEEVRGLVATAAAAQETLKIGAHAKRLKAEYLTIAMSQRRIADELILAAAHAGVAVEMDRAD